MLKRIVAMLLLICLGVTMVAAPQSMAEIDLEAMSAAELEAYIAYLQILLARKQNEEKNDGNNVPEATIIPNVTEEPEPENKDNVLEVLFNDQRYIGTYQGNIENGKPHGQGHFEGFWEGKKLIYDGLWHEGELRGKGVVEAEAYKLVFKDGLIRIGHYAGEVQDGIPEGKGSFSTHNDEGIAWNYTGEWQRGLFHGNGVQKWDDANNQQYAGNFYAGEYAPTLNDRVVLLAEDRDFEVRNSSLSFLEKNAKVFSGTQKKTSPSYSLINSQFEIAKFKKTPAN